MVKLTARRPILYQGRMYEPGDPLPAHDGRMVSAWLDAKSAEWTGEKPATDTAENAAHAGTAESAGNDLEAMKKDDLERLADDMGVKLPRGATKALIVKLLAEEPVQAPASGGGAQ